MNVRPHPWTATLGSLRKLGSCTLGLCTVSLLAAGLTGCKPKPPEPPAPKPSFEMEEPEPPPPPKCEALSEKCQATAATKARVAGVALRFTPPKRWLYAQGKDATVTQKSDDGAVISLTVFDSSSNANELRKRRTDALGELVKGVGVTPRNGNIIFFGASQPDEIAGMQVSFWEQAGAKRGDNTGAILVIATTIGEKEVLGVAFAPKDDADGTSAILDAIRTIQRDSSAASGDEEK